MVRKLTLVALAIAAGTAISTELIVSMPEAKAALFSDISHIYVYGDSYSDGGASLDISTRAEMAASLVGSIRFKIQAFLARLNSFQQNMPDGLLTQIVCTIFLCRPMTFLST